MRPARMPSLSMAALAVIAVTMFCMAAGARGHEGSSVQPSAAKPQNPAASTKLAKPGKDKKAKPRLVPTPPLDAAGPDGGGEEESPQEVCAAVKEASDRMIQEQSAEDPTDPLPTNPAPSNPMNPTKASCETSDDDNRSEADGLLLRPSLRASGASPAIVEDILREYMKPGVTNLAAGCSWWGPPQECLDEAAELLKAGGDDLHKYGDGTGLQELREALLEKLERENGIKGKEVMVTAGANQAFCNVAQALLDEGDRVVVFAPFYFSHEVALQLVGAEILVCQTDQYGQPDVNELCNIMNLCTEEGKDVKMVVMCTVGNPSGVVMTKRNVEFIQEVCRIAKAWLVSDETYEYFTYDDTVHTSPTASEGVINMYSFSKAYGMPGWRVGYMSYPSSISTEIEKVQDTIITMPTILSQKMALRALKCGREWVDEKIKELSKARNLIWDSVKPLCPIKPDGAFYVFVPTPSMLDEAQIVRMFAEKLQIVMVPGSAFGMDHHMRVSFGSIKPEDVEDVAKRLMDGWAAVCREGYRLQWSRAIGHPTANGRDGKWGPPLDDVDELLKAEDAARGRSHTTQGDLHAEDH